MADIIIDGREYTDLKTTYSEKNNINNIYGKEYKVSGTQITNFSIVENEYIDENGEMVIEYYDHDNDITLETMPSPFYPIKRVGKMYSDIGLTTLKDSYDFKAQNAVVLGLNTYLRQEKVDISGTFRAFTTETIYDFNTLSASCSITYNSYVEETKQYVLWAIPQMFSMDTYRNQKLLFEVLRKNEFLTNKDNDGNVAEQIAEERMPSEQSKYISNAVGIITLAEFPVGDGLTTVVFDKPKLISIDENGTTVEVNYKLSIWYGSNIIKETSTIIGAIIDNKNMLNTATKIKFNVQANTIEASENDFSYGDERDNQYELDSNELMQYEEGQSYETRQSYLTSNQMLEKTIRHRMIVSFDLLNCVKRKFGQIGTDDDGNPIYEERFLKEGDLIKIKDPNDNFVGEYYNDNGELITPYFEIISYHGRWDGKFHVEVICKQVL